jgi:hypothetical protein
MNRPYNHEANYPKVGQLPAIGVISRVNFEAFLDGYLTVRDLRLRTFIIPVSMAENNNEYTGDDIKVQPPTESDR